MNIGQAADQSGVSAKMIRYYESVGLVPKPNRKESGYRDYDGSDVHRLAFVRRARDLGFSVDLIRELLDLWGDRTKDNAEVRVLARAHIAEMAAQAAKIGEMISTLQRLVESCKKPNRSDCPIMADLSSARRRPAVATVLRTKAGRGRIDGR